MSEEAEIFSGNPVHHIMFSVLCNCIDSNKIRHLRRRKLGEEKRKLFETIKLYNEQVPDEERIVEEKVESRLSVVGGDSGADSLIWPWEVHSSGMEQFLSKAIVCVSVCMIEQTDDILYMLLYSEHILNTYISVAVWVYTFFIFR